MLKKALQMKSIILTLLIAISVIAVLFTPKFSDELRINEVSFINNEGADWIEIYNPGLNTKSLKGLYLTDDNTELNKYMIKKDILVPPKGFVVIYSKDFEKDSNAQVKANFNIKNGETIYLINRDQTSLVDSMTVVADEDTASATSSMGRIPDGATEVFLLDSSSEGTENIANPK